MTRVFIKTKESMKEAEYIGVFQRSRVINPSPMVGGHPGGVIAYPIAVVKIGDGLREIPLSDLVFRTD